jgi:hypothetical protein
VKGTPWREITPQFLDRVVRALKRWKFDVVGMDQVCRFPLSLLFVDISLQRSATDRATFIFRFFDRFCE